MEKNSLVVSLNHEMNPSQESMKHHRSVDDEGAVNGFGNFTRSPLCVSSLSILLKIFYVHGGLSLNH